MKQSAIVAGVGMTRFGKHADRNLKSLAGEAILQALADAGLGLGDVQAAWMGNAAAAVITGQVCVPGEIVLRETELTRDEIDYVDERTGEFVEIMRGAWTGEPFDYEGDHYRVSAAATRPNHPEQAGRFSSAGGMGFIDGAPFSDRLAASVLVCDVVTNVVHRDALVADGAAFRGTRAPEEQVSEFLASVVNQQTAGTYRTYLNHYVAAFPDTPLNQLSMRQHAAFIAKKSGFGEGIL